MNEQFFDMQMTIFGLKWQFVGFSSSYLLGDHESKKLATSSETHKLLIKFPEM